MKQLRAPQKYPPPKVIFIDVDGTLIQKGILNEKLIKWCKDKKNNGFKLTLWSARGEEHAKKVAMLFKVSDIFDYIISKPGYIVDDLGWRWIKFTRVISLIDIAKT